MSEREFSEGDEVEIDDGSGARRSGVVKQATADSYHVDTAEGHIWVGFHQVFAPSDAEPVAGELSESTDKPKRRGKKALPAAT